MADQSVHLNRTGKRQISGFALPLITVTEIKLTYKLNHASNLHRNLLSLTWRTLGYDRTRVENHCSRSLHQRQRQSYNSDHSLKNETNINVQLRQLNLRAISLPRTAFITLQRSWLHMSTFQHQHTTRVTSKHHQGDKAAALLLQRAW